MNNLKIIILILSLLFLTSSCKKQTSTNKNTPTNSTKADYLSFKYCSEIKYASGFSISINANGYKELIVSDPWNKGKVFQKYYLVARNSNTQTPLDGIKVEVPIRNIASLSNTQIGVLNFINQQDKIIGVSVGDNIYDNYLSEKISEGKISILGHGASLKFEEVLDLSPDLVMVAAYLKKTDTQIKLERAKVNIAYNIEWMEKTPLARAEWCKFIACFFNKEAEADKLFSDLEKRYLEAKKLISGNEKKPSILLGSQFKGIWYTPSGNSYMAELLRDAGANYVWFNKKQTGSLSLNFESVYDKQEDCDIWINPGEFNSIEQMRASDKRYELFRPFKEKNVYARNKRKRKSGANDYWESSVIKVDLLLKDFIKIIHPEKLPNYELYYYNKLH